MKRFTEIVKTIEEEKKNIEILPTGLRMVDEFLEGGIIKKEFVALGAPPGKGKSLFGGTIFYNIARQGFNCAYFSLEISNEMIASRLMGAKSNISPTKIMIKFLGEKEEERKNDAKSEIAVYDEFMTFYDDLYNYADIEKEIREKKYDFVVIDFLQNIMTPHRDEYERLTYIALSIQKLAKEANTAVLALSQLSNQMVRDKRDDIVEYKGSGQIGICCDLGFFIEKSTLPNYATLKLRKNRRGIAGATFNFTVDDPGGMITDSII